MVEKKGKKIGNNKQNTPNNMAEIHLHILVNLINVTVLTLAIKIAIKF